MKHNCFKAAIEVKQNFFWLFTYEAIKIKGITDASFVLFWTNSILRNSLTIKKMVTN